MTQTRCKLASERALRFVLMACILICLQVISPGLIGRTVAGAQPSDGSVLPFPTPPAGSKAARTMQDSTYKPLPKPQRLPKDAPNILIILIDEAGLALPDTYGGDIHSPALSRLAEEGISFNQFHTTAMCSPTRAALLTGRNHHRVGAGVIASLGNDWDGYTGVWPATSASIAKVLGYYGYATSAFGKWHNTPHNETSQVGPFDRWPTGRLIGFDYFYGFLGGETSQWEPALVENFNRLPPIHREGYNLNDDLADKAIAWIRKQRALAPDQPFFMYWAPGAVHGPHHVAKQWADKYKGKFDDGWDAMRERVFARQKQLGYIPVDTKLTPRPETLAAWTDIPESERPFQRRLMEVFAGYCEQTDAEVGRLIDELERQGIRENILVFYIWGDNGSSAEGENGTISEFLAQSGTATKIKDHIRVVNELGGLDTLGGSLFDNMYHAGWGWAGDTPFKGTKLLGAYFGGTRNPMVVSWPMRIKPDKRMRSQFHHVLDIAPTIYEILHIPHPKVVNGYEQLPMDGTGLAYTFDNLTADTRKKTQFFDNNGSRAIYQDDWMACTFGPFIPWDTPGSVKRIASWDSAKDQWELHDLRHDFSQAVDLAAKYQDKLKEMKKSFLALAEDNKAFPIGAGNWLRLHPEDRVKTPYTSWTFSQNTRRMPEFSAPGLGRQSTPVTIDAEMGDNASGVLYAVGGAGGGLTLYMDKGYLVYEYNMMIIEQYSAKSAAPLTAGSHRIEVATDIKGPGQSGTEVLVVDGTEVGKTNLTRTVPAAFTATETFDVGLDLGSPVSLKYFDRRPFRFNGQINNVNIQLK